MLPGDKHYSPCTLAHSDGDRGERVRVFALSRLSQAHSMGSCDGVGRAGLGWARRVRLRVDDEVESEGAFDESSTV